ncbi:DUF559 domain-containing protein [Adhaeribacter rhizoryzae]|uniref:DUF559 domain-containing protein n=1 Tax=Adhaeribacter rhizoryzae TaxID=2607907 RepID=A0A5M6DEN3_9BACT|nr:DUF559 domain-containing protein [Adhaeribacter rhizoryzae]KAA5544850.1 DUF559 domain-containing protein [Adhaeribacter rhizoryzae]
MDELEDSELRYKKFKEYGRNQFIKNEFNELEKITDKWGFIRQMYMEMIPQIMEKAQLDISVPISPYFLDWGTHFSPIEFNAWISIRAIRIALYPQFPLFNYFIDFANPYLRIGLELDGKDYHDEEKDKIRDELLYKFGWKIFRVKGKETNTEFKDIYEIETDFSDFQDEEQRYESLSNWLLNSCDGVINALRIVYFEKEHRDETIWSLAIQTLQSHNLVGFSIIDNEE